MPACGLRICDVPDSALEKRVIISHVYTVLSARAQTGDRLTLLATSTAQIATTSIPLSLCLNDDATIPTHAALADVLSSDGTTDPSPFIDPTATTNHCDSDDSGNLRAIARPPVALYNLIDHAVRSLQVPSEVLVAAVIYLDAALAGHPTHAAITSSTVNTLFSMALVAAMKMWLDVNFEDRDVAAVLGIDVQRFIRLERCFLQCVSYRLYVTTERFVDAVAVLHMHANTAEMLTSRLQFRADTQLHIDNVKQQQQRQQQLDVSLVPTSGSIHEQDGINFLHSQQQQQPQEQEQQQRQQPEQQPEQQQQQQLQKQQQQNLSVIFRTPPMSSISSVSGSTTPLLPALCVAHKVPPVSKARVFASPLSCAATANTASFPVTTYTYHHNHHCGKEEQQHHHFLSDSSAIAVHHQHYVIDKNNNINNVAMNVDQHMAHSSAFESVNGTSFQMACNDNQQHHYHQRPQPRHQFKSNMVEHSTMHHSDSGAHAHTHQRAHPIAALFAPPPCTFSAPAPTTTSDLYFPPTTTAPIPSRLPSLTNANTTTATYSLASSFPATLSTIAFPEPLSTASTTTYAFTSGSGMPGANDESTSPTLRAHHADWKCENTAQHNYMSETHGFACSAPHLSVIDAHQHHHHEQVDKLLKLDAGGDYSPLLHHQKQKHQKYTDLGVRTRDVPMQGGAVNEERDGTFCATSEADRSGYGMTSQTSVWSHGGGVGSLSAAVDSVEWNGNGSLNWGARAMPRVESTFSSVCARSMGMKDGNGALTSFFFTGNDVIWNKQQMELNAWDIGDGDGDWPSAASACGIWGIPRVFEPQPADLRRTDRNAWP